MGQEPDRIRDEIEDTRQRMTETVDALAYKADVKSRAKDRLHETGQRIADMADSAVATVRGTASAAADKVGEGVEMTTSQAGSVRSTARRGVSLAQENPMGLALGAAAAGFLIGIALPSSRVEDERLGEASDNVKQAAAEVGHEALDRGKRVAQAGVEAATTTGQEQAHELAAAAKDKVDEVMPASGDPGTSDGGSDQNAGLGKAGAPG